MHTNFIDTVKSYLLESTLSPDTWICSPDFNYKYSNALCSLMQFFCFFSGNLEGFHIRELVLADWLVGDKSCERHFSSPTILHAVVS